MERLEEWLPPRKRNRNRLTDCAGLNSRRPAYRLRCYYESSMAISEELLEILVCPVCKAKVLLKEDGSGLKCVSCHRVYPVRDDIPVMLKDQATIEP
jgi:uncharacterized protein